MSTDMQPIVNVVMACAFPPPVNGMAAVNAAVREDLLASGVGVLVLDVAAPSIRRDLWSRLGRFPPVLRALGALLCRRGVRNRALYMSVSGGFGQVYEIIFLLAARAKGMRTFLHHHCFAYLDSPGLVTEMLVRAAGKSATHIALSPGMAARLRSTYPRVSCVASVSNTALLLSGGGNVPSTKSGLRTLGFLSNISAEKGVHDFLDVCAAVQEAGLPIRATLAGPFESQEIEQAVRQRLAALPDVTYIGPVYGVDKADFYSGIDVLLFPTRYANEAEPLTIHEAMCNGVPVIAFGRGAIPEILDPACGKVVAVDSDFVSAAMQQIRDWFDDPRSLAKASVAASSRFNGLGAENVRYWRALKTRMMNGNPATRVAGAAESSSSDGSM